MADSLRLQVLLDGVDRLSGPLKRIMGGADGVKRSLRETGKALSDMNRTSKDISSYALLRAKLRGVTAAMQEQSAAAESSKAALESRLTAQRALSVEMKVARATFKQQARAFAEMKEPSAEQVAAFKAQQQAIKKLESDYIAHTAATRAMQKETMKAESHLKKLTRTQSEQSDKVEAARQKLEAAGISTAQMATRQRALRGDMRQTNAAIDQQKLRLERLNKLQATASTMKRGGMLMAAHGAGAWAVKDQFAAPGKTMLGAYAEQETAATELRAAMMGANGQVSASYDRINALAMDLGNKLPGTTAELQNMMTMLKRQGMSDQVILGGLGETAAYLGAQLKMPYVEAAEFSAKLQDATRTTEADMLKLGDTIQRAFYLGVDSDNMLQGFVKLSPAMDILHVQGLEATKVFGPLLVMMDQMGMKGEQSGNALRKVFQGAMGGGVQKANEELAAMGSAVRFDFTDGKGEFGGLDKMFQQLEKFKSLTTQQRLSVMGTMFGDDSETLTTLNAMMNKGQAGYQDVQRKMAAQADLQTRVNASLGTLSALWEAASGTFRNALAAFGEAAAPQIKQITEWLGRVSEKVMAWAKANPTLAAGIVKLSLGAGALLAVLGAVLVPLGIMAGAVGHIVSLFATLRASLGLVANSSGTFASLSSGLSSAGRLLPMLANGARALLPLLGGISLPVLAIGAAIAVVAALVWKYWGPIKAFMVGVWRGIVDALGPVMDALQTAFAPLAPVWAALSDAFGMVAGGLRKLLTPFEASAGTLSGFAEAGRLVGNILGTVVMVPIQLLIGVVRVFVAVLMSAGQFIGTSFAAMAVGLQGTWDVIVGMFTGNGDRIITGLQTIGSNLTQYLKTLGGSMLALGADIIGGLVSGILSMIGEPGRALARVTDGMVTRFKAFLGIKSPSRLFAQFGDYTMQGYANGLDRSGRAPMQAITGVGQRMRAAGAGLALAATVPVMAAGAGGPATSGGGATATAGAATTHLYEIHIHAAPGMNPGEIARAVAAELDRRERQRGAVARSRLSDID